MSDLLDENNREKFQELWARCSPDDMYWIYCEVQKSREKQQQADFRIDFQAKELLHHMSATKGGRKFREVESNLKGIRRVLSEGVSKEDIAATITNQWRLWSTDPVMKHHFSPVTLFRPANFDKYLAWTPAKKVSETIAQTQPEPVTVITDEQFNRNRAASKGLRAILRR